eukprot:7104875-Lingulodinium_polyedra.AAC.1
MSGDLRSHCCWPESGLVSQLSAHLPFRFGIHNTAEQVPLKGVGMPCSHRQTVESTSKVRPGNTVLGADALLQCP